MAQNKLCFSWCMKTWAHATKWRAAHAGCLLASWPQKQSLLANNLPPRGFDLVLLLDLAVVLMPPNDGASEAPAPDVPPPGGSNTTAKHRNAPWPKPEHANEHLFMRFLANKSPAHGGGRKCMAGKMHLAQIISTKIETAMGNMPIVL